MIYLFICAAVSFLFGFFLLLSPGILGLLGAFCNKIILTIDEKLWRFRIALGIILIVIAAWKLYVIVNYELWDVWHIHVPWVVSIIFGLLFLLFPFILKRFSEISNQTVLSTDELVMAGRKIVGIIFIIISLYIFYGAYYLM